MLSDIDCIRSCAYVHRHKLHTKQAGYTEGSNEVCFLVDQLEDMVIWDKPEKKVKKVFTKEPAMCFDNYFSGIKPAEEASKRGFGLLFTTRHDCLPKVPDDYAYKKPTDPKSSAVRGAWFTHPIVMTKRYIYPTTQTSYIQVHVTFQSTSSCNIQLVNMINKYQI
eukprot:3094394-Ditylum_brightwellii.AAC.1